MSTTVKTGWLNDKNGDKFAPKTLTSQVQTSDGILIEDKIQTDLDTVKQEILDAIDPNTIMNYLGEVNELPSEANEGDVYKVLSGMEWVLFKKDYEYSVVECAIAPDYFNVYIYGDSGSIELYDTILEAVNKTGTTPSPIKLVQNGSEYIINVMSHNLSIDTGSMPPTVDGRFYGETNVSEYTYLETGMPTAKFDIYYGINNSGSYVYHNGEWIKLVEAYDDSNIITKISELESYKVNVDLTNVDNTIFKAKIQECGFEVGGGSGSLASESGCFKKIGFTSDCDYIATSTDGLTAFTNAVAEATDSDTILVMPGTYTSSSTLTITKNINFIGISLPTINFPIVVSGNDSNVYITNWENLIFTANIEVQGYRSGQYEGGSGIFNTSNCIFKNNQALTICGTHRNSSFENVSTVYCDNTGAGTSMTFYNCNFKECKNFVHSYDGSNEYNYCNFYNSANAFSFDEGGRGGHNFYNSNIYNYNASSNMLNSSGFNSATLTGCSLFGVLPMNCTAVTLTNTYHYAGSIPGDTSTATVTQSSMESYVNETILGGEW